VGQRTVLVTAHTGKQTALRSARLVAERLTAAGIAVRTLATEFSSPGAEAVPASAEAAEGTELVIVLGGDGALLRAAELSRPAGVPLIGVNHGHVGFLAEAEPDGLADTVDRLAAQQYAVEERMTIDVTVRGNGSVVASTWALNEATVEKAARSRAPSPPRTMTSSAPSAASALAGTASVPGELNSVARVRTATPAAVSRSATSRALRSAVGFPVCAVTSTVRCPTSQVPPGSPSGAARGRGAARRGAATRNIPRSPRAPAAGSP